MFNICNNLYCGDLRNFTGEFISRNVAKIQVPEEKSLHLPQCEKKTRYRGKLIHHRCPVAIRVTVKEVIVICGGE